MNGRPWRAWHLALHTNKGFEMAIIDTIPLNDRYRRAGTIMLTGSGMRRIAASLATSLLAALLLGAVLLAQPANAQDSPAAYIAQIESAQVPDRQGLDALTLPEIMHKLHVPGVSVAVVRDFKIHWAKAYGVSDVTSGRVVDTDTVFQAASLSKAVTALGVLELVQEKRLSLDQDINTYLRAWRVPRSSATGGEPVTLRSLLSHTSGADDGFGFPGYDPGAAVPTVVQILNGLPPSNVGPVTFARPPYAAYKYSGGGLLIVEQAMTDVSGMEFSQLLNLASSAHCG